MKLKSPQHRDEEEEIIKSMTKVQLKDFIKL